MADFLFSGWFWGFILIIVATGSILKSIFKIRFSLFLTFVVILIIFFLVNLTNTNSSESVTLIASKEIIRVKEISEINQYNCAFCRITFDLTLMETLPSEHEEIEINNLMGKLKILINKSQKIKIQSRVFFGTGKTPDEIKTLLGNNTYISPRYSKFNPYTTINLETIFGSTEVYEK